MPVILLRGNRGSVGQAQLARALVVVALLLAASPAQGGCGDHVLSDRRGGPIGITAHTLPRGLLDSGAPLPAFPCSGLNCGRGDPQPLAPTLPVSSHHSEQWLLLTDWTDAASPGASLDRLPADAGSAPEPLGRGIFHPPR